MTKPMTELDYKDAGAIREMIDHLNTLKDDHKGTGYHASRAILAIRCADREANDEEIHKVLAWYDMLKAMTVLFEQGWLQIAFDENDEALIGLNALGAAEAPDAYGLK